jgi:hypothetical protein
VTSDSTCQNHCDAVLEHKSGALDPSIHRRKSGPRSQIYGQFQDTDGFVGNHRAGGDTGSYSRYFDLDAWARTLPFLIVPKASKSEKNDGLEDWEPVRRADRFKDDGIGGNNPRNRTNIAKLNHHPTVKPLRLMAYLITLGSRPGDVVLDPFLGSGTTALEHNSSAANGLA